MWMERIRKLSSFTGAKDEMLLEGKKGKGGYLQDPPVKGEED